MELNVISSSSCRNPAGPAFLEDVITCDSVLPEQSIIDIPQRGMFILWTVPVSQSHRSGWELDDALRHCFRFFYEFRGDSSTSFLFNLPKEKNNNNTAEENCPTTILVSIASPSAVALDSVILSRSDRALLDRALAKQNDGHLKHWSRAFFREWPGVLKRRGPYFYILAAGVILTLVVLIMVSSVASRQPSIWQRYDTTGSVGPRYQLQFSHHNVSEWAASHAHGHGEWFLRIDDQAMIPADLLDDEERHYQAWFQRRYPEANQIRLNEDYLKESFLSDPSAIQVPADKQFHMAHCVLAVRRYWRARETGRHVCPRDIDYKHMKHCLDALDTWAFPKGPRGSGMGHDDSAIDTTRLVWRTKVCF